MKSVPVSLSVVLALGSFATAQSSRPAPAGMRHAQELEAQNERDFPPIATKRTHVSPAVLQHEADRLASLAASVGPGIQKLDKGFLEKDLTQKLKEIEKLSKQLRNEISR